MLAGVGSCTRTVVPNSVRAASAGAQGLLVTAPYYNKPTQRGSSGTSRPSPRPAWTRGRVHVPGRTGVKISPETIERLAAIDNITCVKDATGDLAHAAEVRRRVGDELALLSGDDFTTVPHVMVGGVGAISVASYLMPARMVAMVAAAGAGRFAEAQ